MTTKRMVPGCRWPNFCDLITAAPFPDRKAHSLPSSEGGTHGEAV
jgi:hypothetical protein